MKKIGLVTVLYRSGEVLDDFFASIAKLNCMFCLYVIDNNEVDRDGPALRRAAAKYDVEYQYVEYGVNRGVAQGNNIGVNLALADGCDWLGIINNDIVFDDAKLVSSLVHAAESAGCDAAVPFMYYFNSKTAWFDGGRFARIKATTPHDGTLTVDGGVSFTDYAPTCFMVVSAKAFISVGYFDEKYFVYYDDADWVYRYRKVGGRIVYCRNLCVAHKVSVSTGGNESNFSVFYSTRNRIYFAWKNYSLGEWLLFLLYFLAVRVPVRLVKLNQILRTSYVKGIYAGFRMLK